MLASPRFQTRLQLALLALAVLAAAGPVHARDTVPTPPGGGTGVKLLPADQLHPTALPAPRPELLSQERTRAPEKGGLRFGDLGGDDIPIATVNDAHGKDLAVAANGDLFAIIGFSEEDQGDNEFEIHRSDDGGTTWRSWGGFSGPAPGYSFFWPEIHVAEGIEDRVFVVYSLDTGSGDPREVHVAWSPLDLETGDFSQDTTVFTASHRYVFSPSFTTDAVNWNEYYCYLAFSADDGDGNDIHFVRSLDQGTTWEASYVLGTISVGDRGYYHPQVAVGYQGWVHVAWFLGFDTDHEFDNTIRYRRAPNYASGGLGNWENVQSITPHTDDIDMITTRLAASWISPDLVMAFNRRVRYPDGTYSYDGIITLDSADSGEHWSDMNVVGAGYRFLGDLLHQESTGRWLMSGSETTWSIRWASLSAPADWSEPLEFADGWYSSSDPALIVDPDRGGRMAVMGGGAHYDDTYTYYFDAEWRADPGYPNLEDGFPVDLTAAPSSDPAVVDLDGDGTLEIVFTDAADRIQVYQADGTPLAGWPVQVSAALVETPVAIGDLDGDGALSVVVGTMSGLVAVYAADGTLEDGWPVDVVGVGPAHVAIGSVGGPYPRAIVAGSGHMITLLDWHGEAFPQTTSAGFSARDITSPPAIGDVDGDGQNDIVVAGEEVVMVFRPRPSYELDFFPLEADVTGGVTLADFDLDGDVEIVAALANGVVHLLDADGSEFPGAWPVAAAGSAINGTAIGQFLSTSEPEIALTAHDSEVSVLRYDGEIGNGWPEDTDGWYVFGKPVIGRVDGSSSDVVVGSRGSRAWAWTNLSAVIPGWPKAVANHIYRTPAYGDIDLDGNAEIAFLTLDQLVVVDVAISTSDATKTWAMAGHDFERSGCSDCTRDVVAVEDAPAGVTRVSMAAPWPNPIAGQATFSYAVPIRARVELAVYDVRGRRVATVHRAEEAAGQHVIGWNGRDRDGRPVASGQYVAALKVTGPGVDETVSRKVTVLR